MTWTDERIAILRKLWSEGLSCSQIATQLGDVSRNAVIGKITRLGLAGRAKGRPKNPAPRPHVQTTPRGQPASPARKAAQARDMQSAGSDLIGRRVRTSASAHERGICPRSGGTQSGAELVQVISGSPAAPAAGPMEPPVALPPQRPAQVEAAVEPEDIAGVDDEAPSTEGVHLFDLAWHHCRRPLWPDTPRPTEAQLRFCGATTAGAERSYCRTCEPRMYPARRAATQQLHAGKVAAR